MKANLKQSVIQQGLLAAALLALPVSGWAQFNFITNNGAIYVTGYTGPGGNVIIPSTINGYPVTTIGFESFYYQTAVISVTIPSSVTWIGYAAFRNCYGLRSVTIPNSVISIDGDAFSGSGLTSVTIPDSTSSIGDYAFSYCSSLTNIAVSAGNPSYASGGGVLFNKAMTTLIQFPEGLAGSYAIPNSVTSIGDHAFAGSGLTNVTIPNSVISIDDAAFLSCHGLTSVTIPNSVTSIGDYAFENCSGLTSMTVPNSVTNIGSLAFNSCPGLTNVTIPNSVISIGDHAFEGCSGLTSVTIPDSTSSIGDVAFFGCSSLTNIAVNAGNPSYASGGGVLFNKAMTTLIQFPEGLAGSYAIPNSVTNIGDNAFNSCFGLTSVTIPNSVTSIGDWAFSGSGLTNLTMPNSVTNIGSYAFLFCGNLHEAYFQGNAPSVDDSGGSADGQVFGDFGGETGTVYYVPGTTGWGATFGGWPTAQWYQPQPQILGSGYGLGVQSNRFNFTISWGTNTSVVVEVSTNLQNWTPVVTNTLVNGTNAFSDPAFTNFPQRFYRVRSP